MKRNLIRLVCLLLIAAILLPGIPAVFAENLEYGWILVDYFGARDRTHILLNEDGEIYAPLTWITDYGAVSKQEKDGFLVYYHWEQKQERTFAKRLFIDPDSGEFMAGIWFGKNELKDKDREHENYYPLYKGTFSDKIEHDGEIWVPIAELLPLMEVQATVGDDGYLYLRPVVMTTFRALYKHAGKIGELLFDADSQIDYDELLATVGSILDTIFAKRPDGGVLFKNQARMNDYEEVFKTYLMDDAVYLSTFDSEGNIFGDYIHEVASGEEETNFLIEISEGFFKNEAIKSVFQFNPDLYKEGVEGLEKTYKGISGIISLYSFADVYFNHIEDHRRMLDAVYGYEKDIAKTPSGKAAASVSELYNRNADNSEELVREGFRDIVEKALSGLVPDEVMTPLVPWYVALEITRIFADEELDYVSAVRLIPMVDNTVSYSHSIYEKRLKKGDFSETGADDLRLSLLMSLVGSYYAYETYWENEKKDEKQEIADIMEDLYIAGVFREHDTSDSYKKWKTRYAEELQNLIVDDPAIHAELSKLEYAQAMTLFEWSLCQDYEWTLVDVDDDGAEELLVQGTMETQTPLGLLNLPFSYIADATSGRNVCYTPLLGLLIPEYVTAGGTWYLKDGERCYTWGGMNWKQTEAPAEAAKAVFDCPDLKDFTMEGGAPALLEMVERLTENRSDCTGVIRTDLDFDGDEDLLAVFDDPGNRWSNTMKTRDGLTYDVDLRTDGVTAFLVALAGENCIRIRTGAEFWTDNADVSWQEADHLLKIGDSLWEYREEGDYPMVMHTGPAFDAVQVPLVDLMGLPSDFVGGILGDYQEYDSVEAFLSACPYSGKGAVPLGSGRVGTGYLGDDFVYVLYENLNGFDTVCQAGMDCYQQSAEIFSGVPNSLTHEEFMEAVFDSTGEWTSMEAVYDANGEITGWSERFIYFHPGADMPYSACLILEDEFYDSYISSIHLIAQSP